MCVVDVNGSDVPKIVDLEVEKVKPPSIHLPTVDGLLSAADGRETSISKSSGRNISESLSTNTKTISNNNSCLSQS